MKQRNNAILSTLQRAAETLWARVSSNADIISSHLSNAGREGLSLQQTNAISECEDFIADSFDAFTVKCELLMGSVVDNKDLFAIINEARKHALACQGMYADLVVGIYNWDHTLTKKLDLSDELDAVSAAMSMCLREHLCGLGPRSI